jgi:hypothetical protein
MSRRNLIKRSALLGGSAALLSGGAQVIGKQAEAAVVPASPPPVYGPVTVTPTDPRYTQLVTAFNNRWVGSPQTVQLVSTTSQVANAVQAAVNAGQRITVRGGGHCYANFVFNPAVQTVIDLSMMNQVYFDPSMNAFAAQGGATLGDIYETLYRGYGVTLPGGHCPGTGIGGHATGGGHGMLSRKYGLITDHILAVEIVTVDAKGHANVTVANRYGPNADLWWAISGAGGGNYGVITRYWFRSPSATTATGAAIGTNPSQLLPAPPTKVYLANFTIPWSSLTQAQFTALVSNLGTFLGQNSAPTSPYTAVSTTLTIPHVSSGSIGLTTVADATVPNAAQLVQNYHTALTAGTGVTPNIPFTSQNWLSTWETINTAIPLIETNALFRNAVKSAFLVNGFTPAQIAAIYANMTTSSYSNPLPALLQLGAMAGGQISAVAQSATAISYRTSTLLAFFNVYWTSPADDATNIGWLRNLYSQTFASTGGVPDPANPAYEGACINLPDLDMADPTINTSGVSWQTLYYGTNYPRLQQVKATWDPTNFFQHPMSITAS